MINRVILIGRLTKELDLRKSTSGKSVMNFTLAVNRLVRNEGQPDADFIQCQAWGKTAEVMVQYLSKGSLIAICGRMQTRHYQGDDGRRIYVTEVIVEQVEFLDSKKNTQPQEHESNFQEEDVQDYQPSINIVSDDLPF